jgi:3-deoxy-D-arabino-heptulosonate 7-phosphate (DAHP) synthase class II
MSKKKLKPPSNTVKISPKRVMWDIDPVQKNHAPSGYKRNHKDIIKDEITKMILEDELEDKYDDYDYDYYDRT